MRKIKISIIAIALIGLAIYLIYPWSVASQAFWKPGWWEKSLFNFSKYSVPEGFKVVSYSEGAPGQRDEKYLIILENEQTGQLISFARLKGFSSVPFKQIEIDGREISEPFRFNKQRVADKINIFTYLPFWPFLEKKEDLPNNLLIRGFQAKNRNEYSTDNAYVFYAGGSFRKIGFFKRMPFPFGFATTVFDFSSQQKGSIVILNNKKNDESIIVIASIPSQNKFDEEAVKKFVLSVSFDKEVYKPALLEGVNEPKPSTNLSF